MLQSFGRMLGLAGILVAALQAADPAVGTWILDLKKSSFSPGPPPKSETRVYRESAEGITATAITTTVKGDTYTVEYPVNYDGHSHRVTGSTDFDAIEMTRVSQLRAESILMHAGHEIGRATREVSADGQTLIIDTERTSSSGEKVHNRLAYHRQTNR
jgi:hypothetical protein